MVLDSSRICAPSSHWACVVTNCSMLGQAELTSLKKYDGGGEEGGGDGDGGGEGGGGGSGGEGGGRGDAAPPRVQRAGSSLFLHRPLSSRPTTVAIQFGDNSARIASVSSGSLHSQQWIQYSSRGRYCFRGSAYPVTHEYQLHIDSRAAGVHTPRVACVAAQMSACCSVP